MKMSQRIKKSVQVQEEKNKDNNTVFYDIKGYEGYYKINKKGDVISLPRQGVKEVKTKKTILSKDGYLKISLNKKRKKRYTSVHRILAETFIPKPYDNDKLQVNHKNGIKLDNRLENLEWVTQSQNAQHSFDNGLQIPLKGEKNPASKLTKEKVREIILLINNKEKTDKEIAEIYNVSRNVITSIAQNRTWKEIKREKRESKTFYNKEFQKELAIKRKNNGSTKGSKNYRYINLDINKIIELRKQKYSHRKIADIFNCSFTVIRNRLKEVGLK
jgi:hypothetical protein